MHRKLSGFALLVTLATPAVALAQSDIPDLTGRWSVETEGGVSIPAGGSAKPSGVRSVFVIDWQEGIRFSRREVSQESTTEVPLMSNKEQFAGVINSDTKTVYIVDENGFQDCWILSPVSIRCVYRHILPEQSKVNLDVCTKQPE